MRAQLQAPRTHPHAVRARATCAGAQLQVLQHVSTRRACTIGRWRDLHRCGGPA